MPKFRAPRDDGELLLWPPAEQWPSLAVENRRRLRGLPGRREHPVPLIVTGHQAEPYHPGVWVKNFLARRLADAVGGESLNLTVDTDAPRTGLLALPTLRAGRAAVRTVRFADWRSDTALREQHLSRDAVRAAVGELCRALQEVAAGPDQCRALGFWQGVLAECQSRNAADALTAGRLRAEAELGLANTEAAVSSLDLREFREGLAERAEAFRDAYNAAVEDFRRRHRVRGRGRPVPLLEAATERGRARIELPFWGWRTGGPRQRAFVRGSQWFLDADPVEPGAITFAPRALALTLWARLMLADLFIHGIGGGVYDEVTDDIIRRFWHIEPPTYVVASATLHLELPTTGRSAGDRVAAVRALRDWQHNPERLLSPLSPSQAELAARKAELIAEADAARAVGDRTARAAAHARRAQIRREIRGLNEQLRVGRPQQPELLRERLAEVADELAADRVARSREWFFGLYPPARLRQLIASLPSFR